MSVLVVGMSHNSAPVSLLEAVAVESDALPKVITDLSHCEHVVEATVVSTCNRIEIYAEVDRFHGSVEDLSRKLIERAGGSVDQLLSHLYVHYDDGAVSHLFRVAAGLDSMAVGEAQILGQTRAALQLGQELGTVGPALNSLFQQALRVGKRVRAETDIDRAAPTLVSAALERAGDVTGRKVLVLGAGAMAGLAAATVSRGDGDLVVANRTPERAARVAAEYGGRATGLDDVAAELSHADIVIACAGARGILITADMVRDRGDHDLVLIDLALPHDIEPAASDIPGVTRIDLASLADTLRSSAAGQEVEAVRGIVAQEVTAFLQARAQASVTPTVVALRTMATDVVDAEMQRLDGRLPGLDADARAEIVRTVRRVADKLLHEPTVRVKELTDSEGGVSYATALAELFALDPDAVDAVTRPAVDDGRQSEGGPS